MSVQIQKRNVVRKSAIVCALPDKTQLTVVQEDCCQPRLVIVGQKFNGKDQVCYH